MVHHAVLGAQWGDEGKAKDISFLMETAPEEFDVATYVGEGHPFLVVRYQGAGNAGHTTVVNRIIYKTHNMPSGVIYPNTFSLLAGTAFINPRKIIKEIQDLREQGLEITPENFGIAANTHVIFDYHTKDDQKDYDKGDDQHTSTGNGIRQVATDKANRVGIRFIEFLDPKTFRECLERRFPEGIPKKYVRKENEEDDDGDDDDKDNIGSFIAKYESEREFLTDFAVQEHEVRRTHGLEYTISEGAQAVLLDIDVGQYPGITSSKPASPPHRPDKIILVYKLYTSNVGTGDRPFVAQMDKDIADKLREFADEFGTTTGRPRSLGWFDVVAARYTLEATQADVIAANRGDTMEVFAKIGEKIRLVTGYKLNGKTYTEWDINFHKRDVLWGAEPVFEEFDPWTRFVNDNNELTPNAARYVDRIQELLGKEFSLLGTGPASDEIIVVHDIFK